MLSRHSRSQLLRSCAAAALQQHHHQPVERTFRGPLAQQPATFSTAAAAAHEITAAAQQALEAHGLEPWSGFGMGIERAVTLPASWYTSPTALALEQQHVLYNTWQMVASVSQVQQPGDYLTGTIGDVRFLLVRGPDGQLRAFHNVCRHHAAAVAQGCGHQASLQFACPYHGWTYGCDGRLLKATRLAGIKNFKASSFGLHRIATDTWGDMVFLHLQGGGGRGRGCMQQQQQQGAVGGGPQQAAAGAAAPPPPPGVAAWLGGGHQRLQEVGMADTGLVHLCRREYVLECNWKVFCDNYLDGGYHVPYAHKGLASGLDLSGYTNELHELLSIQRCGAKQPADSKRGSSSSSSNGVPPVPVLDRLAGGRDPAYAFVFPNLMINRYGPWMDTNVVLPLTGSSVDRCRVVFDYWLDADAVQQAAGSSSSSSSSSGSIRPSPEVLQAALQSPFVQQSLADSHKVQEEDVALCEAVQAGLRQPAYGVGRYAPGPEAPMYHFHALLYSRLLAVLAPGSWC